MKLRAGQFTCYRDICRTGEEYCSSSLQLCLRCIDFMFRCFTDQHVSNCTISCNENDPGPIVTTTSQLETDDDSNVLLPVLAILISAVLVSTAVLLLVHRQVLQQRLASWCHRTRMLRNGPDETQETILKSAVSHQNIADHNTVPKETIRRHQNNPGYKRLEQGNEIANSHLIQDDEVQDSSHPTNKRASQGHPSPSQCVRQDHSNREPSEDRSQGTDQPPLRNQEGLLLYKPSPEETFVVGIRDACHGNDNQTSSRPNGEVDGHTKTEDYYRIMKPVMVTQRSREDATPNSHDREHHHMHLYNVSVT